MAGEQIAAAWRPFEPGIETRTKRFFIVDDGDADYWLVAWDLEHAKSLLRSCGIEFGADDGYSRPIDHPDVAHVEWIEISVERAAKINVHRDDNCRGPTVPLSECVVGDWFSTEW